MKFKIKDRIAIAFYGLFGLLIGAAAGYAAYLFYVGKIFADFDRSRTLWVIVGVIAALAIIAYSIYIIRFSLKRAPKADKETVAIQHTDAGNGSIRVSMQALETLVQQTVSVNANGINDVKTHLINRDDSISVQIELALQADVHIPTITMLLQSSIKNFVEEYAGIAVRDVAIIVKTIVPVPTQLAIEEKQAEPVSQIEEATVQAENVVEPQAEAEAAVVETIVSDEFVAADVTGEDSFVSADQIPEDAASDENKETQEEE